MGIRGACAVGNLGASLRLAFKKRCASYVWVAPIVFGIRRLAHGLGALLGIVLVLVPGKRWEGRWGWLGK